MVTKEATAPLRERWERLKAKEKGIRIRNAAGMLGVSEAELLSTLVGDSVTRLKIDHWAGFYIGLKKLGRVMALTRNEHVVHERTGRFGAIEAGSDGLVGITTDGDIELRLLFRQWKHAFAVIDGRRNKPNRSFQFFDRFGTAVHKVYVRSDEGISVFERIAGDYADTDQTTTLLVDDDSVVHVPESSGEFDVNALHQAWQNLDNIHDFNAMLSGFGLNRVSALKLIGRPWSRRVSNRGLRMLFGKLSASSGEVMIFVGNSGCVQIHIGMVKKLVDYGHWFNVLDPGFNLHLDESGIASSWVVTKRVKGNDIRSLELFDSMGESMIQVFGTRNRETFDPEAWKTLMDELPDAEGWI